MLKQTHLWCNLLECFCLNLPLQEVFKVRYQVYGLCACLVRQLLVEGNHIFADTGDVLSQTGVEMIFNGVVGPIYIFISIL